MLTVGWIFLYLKKKSIDIFIGVALNILISLDSMNSLILSSNPKTWEAFLFVSDFFQQYFVVFTCVSLSPP